MVRNMLLAVTLVLCSAIPGFAAGLDGRWQGIIESPEGEMDVIFNFTVDGETLTGYSESLFGELPLLNGTVHGDTYHFDVDINGMLLPHEGTVSGDTITMQAEGIQDALTFTRMGSAGFDGKWFGIYEAPEGDMELVYEFHTDGDTVSGWLSSPMGDLPINDGTVDGNVFSFDIDTGSDSIIHHCVYSDDTVMVEAVGYQDKMILTRVEE